jgi:membrane protease YdiL (CAAX protease family)
MTSVEASADSAASRMPVTFTIAEQEGRTLIWPRWGVWDAVIAIGGFIVLTALVAIPLIIFDADLVLFVFVGGLIPWLMLAGWPVYATWRKGNGARIDLGLILRWSDVGWGMVFGIAGLLVAGVGAYVTTLIVGDFNSAAGEVALELRESSSTATLLAFAVVIAVGAPVVEEIAFRGMLFGALRKRGINPIWVVVITAVAFSLFHLEPTRILVLLPIGITLGLARWKTDGLGAPIVAHMVNNLPAAVFLLIDAPGVTP